MYMLQVYDITKRSSFLSLQKWMEEIRRFTASNISWILIGNGFVKLNRMYFKTNIIFKYLGNKCDKEAMREVEQIEASTMAEMVPEIMLVLESSAKENTNVEKCFVELATELKVCDAKSNSLLLDTFSII